MKRVIYKPKNKNINKLIFASGLCGKGLLIKENKDDLSIINHYEINFSKLDENYLYYPKTIRKKYNKILKKYTNNNIQLDEYNQKSIINNILKFCPVIYCKKCKILNKYRVYYNNGGKIECNKCVEKRSANYVKTKRKEDDKYRFISSFRKTLSYRIKRSIKDLNHQRNTKSNEILGCSFDFFIQHIENQFTKGMNWQNYGKWHLDHIYPISKAKTIEEAYILNHYSNFQPLWAMDNFKKNAKVVPQQLKLNI